MFLCLFAFFNYIDFKFEIIKVGTSTCFRVTTFVWNSSFVFELKLRFHVTEFIHYINLQLKTMMKRRNKNLERFPFVRTDRSDQAVFKWNA